MKKLFLLILPVLLCGNTALAQCPKGFTKNMVVGVCTLDIDENDKRTIKLTFKEGLNKYEAYAVSNALRDVIGHQYS